MAATNGALLAQYQSYATSAPFLASAFTDNQSNADLLQIVNGQGQTILAVQNNGTVNFNSAGLTPVAGASANGSYTVTAVGAGRAQIGVFRTRQTESPSSAAAAIASAFPTNPNSQDIIQVVQEGGSVGYWLDSSGVAHGS